MKKKAILTSTALISTFATAGFVAVIDADSGGDYKTITNVNKKITCGIGEGVTRNQLDSMISNNEDITNVCTSNIQNFSYLFRNLEAGFGMSISSLSSDEVLDLQPYPPESEGGSTPKFEVTEFNQDISNWDVSNGTNFEGMFYYTKKFNQDISGWDVSSGTNFGSMFKDATSFNQDIGDWNVGKAKVFAKMFENAKSFNKNISNWDVSNGINFESMFYSAKNFNQDISNWNVSKGEDFQYMFSESTSFNQPIGNWDVSQGKYFKYMFKNAISFNQPISDWETLNGGDFTKMFSGATSFNQDIHLWNTSSATIYSDFGEYSGLSLDNMPCKFGGNCFLDTDKDGYSDIDEIEYGTDPLNIEDYPMLVNHPSTMNTVIVVDNKLKYFDNGGLKENYSDNINTEITFKPKNKGDLISITFNNFNLQSSDDLRIYNMKNTPELVDICFYSSCLGKTFTGTNADGELKVIFKSNSSYNSFGWEAVVQSITPSNIDTDNDGLIDAIDNDDDNDGFDDDIEIAVGSNPLDLNDVPLDTDNDGSFDYFDKDDDNDGFTDYDEISIGTDPLDVNDFPKLIKHPVSGNVTQIVDGKYIYFDDGGEDEDHSANINNTLLTFVPMNSGEVVTVTFEDFKTSSYRAELYIYSGDSADSSNFLAKCEGTNCKGKTYKSASSDGKLTFKFHSGGSWRNDGWFAKISTTP